MGMIACRECNERVSEWAAMCPHCGIPGQNGGMPVADFRMKFGSMVGLMVKMAIAAVPATIILGVIVIGIAGITAGIIGR